MSTNVSEWLSKRKEKEGGKRMKSWIDFSVEIPTKVQILLLEQMADIEYRLAAGANEKIQLSALIAAFQLARDIIANQSDHDNQP